MLTDPLRRKSAKSRAESTLTTATSTPGDSTPLLVHVSRSYKDLGKMLTGTQSRHCAVCRAERRVDCVENTRRRKRVQRVCGKEGEDGKSRSKQFMVENSAAGDSHSDRSHVMRGCLCSEDRRKQGGRDKGRLRAIEFDLD